MFLVFFFIQFSYTLIYLIPLHIYVAFSIHFVILILIVVFLFIYFFYIQFSYPLIYVKPLHIDGSFSNHFAILILIAVFLVIFVLSQMNFLHLLLFVLANLLFSDKYF